MNQTVFPTATKQSFARSYPETACSFRHHLGSHQLLSLDALADLAGRLPDHLVECADAEQPMSVHGRPRTLRRTGRQTIATIESCNSWVMLKHGDRHDPAYRRLMEDLLSEMRPEIERRTGEMMGLESFIFVTSGGGLTPYHFDPEHNILMQVRGIKTVTTFPPGDPRFAADEMHEIFHRGGSPELPWDEAMAPGGTPHVLTPGDAVYIPVMAPHFVKNGPEVSVSLSVTWRSGWSFAEADARAFNSLLRKVGLKPAPPPRWPACHTGKAMAWRMARRIPGFID